MPKATLIKPAISLGLKPLRIYGSFDAALKRRTTRNAAVQTRNAAVQTFPD
jgi:hypothetical protein